MTVAPETVARIKVEWDKGRQSAEAIGVRFGVSKNVIVGLAHRRGWTTRRGPDLRKPVREQLPASKVKECAWPHGDPYKPDFHFCGAPPVEGKPYCDEHCARAYSNWEEVRPAKDDE